MFNLTAPKTQKGFSTLEILLAMFVLVTAISAVVLVSSGNQTMITDSQTSAEALNLAQGLLEKEQSLARKDFSLVNATSTSEGIYTEEVDVVPGPDLFSKIVTATVKWNGEYNRELKTQLSALVTNFNNAIGGDTCSSLLYEMDASNNKIRSNWLPPVAVNTDLAKSDLAQLVGDSGGHYNISDVDVYQKKLYVTVANSHHDVGPNEPALVQNDGSGLSWSSPENAADSDTSNASVALSGTGSTTYIKATNFGFNVPLNATIIGINVQIQKSVSGGTTGHVQDSSVEIVKGGVISSGLGRSDSSYWPSAEAYSSYGKKNGGSDNYPIDLWDETWTPVDINSSGFGVAISAKGSSAATDVTANIDDIRITVSYIAQFYVFDMTHPVSPNLIGTLASNEGVKTGFNAVATNGQYAYAATNSGPASVQFPEKGQLQIIDVSSATSTVPVVADTYSIPGPTGDNAVGSSIFYKDGFVYLGLAKTDSGPEFNIINVRNPLDPSWVGGYQVGSQVNSIYVKDGYAYLAHPVPDLASPFPKEQLTVLDVTNPAVPKRVSGFFQTSPIGGYGKAAVVVGKPSSAGYTLYLGRTTSSPGSVDTVPEFYVLDATDPNAVSQTSLGSLPLAIAGDSIDNIIIRDYLGFILTNNQLIIGRVDNPPDIGHSWTNASYPLPVSGGQTPPSMDCEGNYIYIASNDSSGNGRLTIITGQ